MESPASRRAARFVSGPMREHGLLFVSLVGFKDFFGLFVVKVCVIFFEIKINKSPLFIIYKTAQKPSLISLYSVGVISFHSRTLHVKRFEITIIKRKGKKKA